MSCAARCDQIIALIDDCLTEIEAVHSVPPPAERGSMGLTIAYERAKRHWAMASDSSPLPLDAA